MLANISNPVFGACVGFLRLHHNRGDSCRTLKSRLTDDIRKREISYSGRVRACPLSHSQVDHLFLLVADGCLDLRNKDRRHPSAQHTVELGGSEHRLALIDVRSLAWALRAKRSKDKMAEEVAEAS